MDNLLTNAAHSRQHGFTAVAVLRPQFLERPIRQLREKLAGASQDRAMVPLAVLLNSGLQDDGRGAEYS
jgi:hypothetical protein